MKNDFFRVIRVVAKPYGDVSIREAKGVALPRIRFMVSRLVVDSGPQCGGRNVNSPEVVWINRHETSAGIVSPPSDVCIWSKLERQRRS